MSIRKASHAGSWYTNNGSLFFFVSNNNNTKTYLIDSCAHCVHFEASELGNQLTGWLNQAKYCNGPAKAIISP